MKKTICLLGIVLLLSMLVGSAALAADTTIKDVPTSHWAYQAVKMLVAQGYLGLYADNTFRGDNPVDRYTLAVVVAKLLENGVSGQANLSKDDAALLRKLTTEFRDELVKIAAETDDLQKAVEKYERDRAAMSSDLAELTDDLAGAIKDIIALKDRVTALEKITADDQKAIGDLENQVKDLSLTVDQLKKDMSLWKIIAIIAGVLALVK